MSWHCLPALVEEYSAGSCSGGEPSAPSKLMPTAEKCFCDASETACWACSQSGMTCEPSMVNRGVESWIASLVASRAKTSALPGKGPVLRESEAGSGRNSHGSLAKYDRATCSWRTAQRSLDGDLIEFSETFPRWGSMRSGALCSRPTPLGLEAIRLSITTAQESGSSRKIQTVTASVGERGGRGDLLGMIRGYEYRKQRHSACAVKMPTPTATERIGQKVEVWERRVEKLKQLKINDNGAGMPLAIAAQVATPTARDWRSGKASEATHEKNSRPLSEQVGGQLNPPWVEWLMGWPIGWTALEPLETDKFRQWCDSHGIC